MRSTYLMLTQDTTWKFLAKCLSETSTNWTFARISQIAKNLESNRAIAKHKTN